MPTGYASREMCLLFTEALQVLDAHDVPQVTATEEFEVKLCWESVHRISEWGQGLSNISSSFYTSDIKY